MLRPAPKAPALQHPDDNEVVVAARLKVYEEKTRPLVQLWPRGPPRQVFDAEGGSANRQALDVRSDSPSAQACHPAPSATGRRAHHVTGAQAQPVQTSALARASER